MRLALVLVALLIALPANAAPKALKNDEIRALLTGNTVHGTWSGAEYYSYFETGGSTTFIPVGHSPSIGRWSVHDDQYCSTWANANETCYALEMDGDTLIWLYDDNRYSSQILPGNQLPK